MAEMTDTLWITENAYVLCPTHLAAWRASGNDVAAHPLAEAEADDYRNEWLAEPQCCDCAPAVEADDRCFNWETV